MKKLNVAIIGTGFMGRAHSNAWSQLGKFFNIPFEINLKCVAGRDEEKTRKFAQRWGYEEYTADWHTLLNRDDIDIICILTPTDVHKEMAVAAMQAGKHVVCEKPCALTWQDCEEMAAQARKAGVVSYLNHNYRRVPAVALAKKMIEEGKIGTVYHWKGAYLQEWGINASSPFRWQFDKNIAGAGPLYDLSSHAVDLARFLVGEPKSVMAMTKTFIAERPGQQDGEQKVIPVTVDDAAFMVLEFENGALGNIDSTRYAAGRKNGNTFELYGSKGSICFDFERMNELEFYDNTVPACGNGYKKIIVNGAGYPYSGAWWPAGHSIGYEHPFVHAFYDFVQAIENHSEITPNFEDGARIMKVLQAAQKSAETGKRIGLEEEV